MAAVVRTEATLALVERVGRFRVELDDGQVLVHEHYPDTSEMHIPQLAPIVLTGAKTSELHTTIQSFLSAADAYLRWVHANDREWADRGITRETEFSSVRQHYADHMRFEFCLQPQVKLNAISITQASKGLWDLVYEPHPPVVTTWEHAKIWMDHLRAFHRKNLYLLQKQ